MTTINDREWAFLSEQTGMQAPFNDMYFKYLRSLGYTGTLQDMIAAYGYDLTPSRGGVPYDEDAQLYFDRLPDDPDNAYKTAINNLIVAAKAHGWWNKTDALHLLASDTVNNYKINVRQDKYNITAFNNPTFTPYEGITGNGVNAYLSSGFNPLASTEPNLAALVSWQLTSSPAGTAPTESPAGQINFNPDGTNNQRAYKIITTIPGRRYRVGFSLAGNVVNLAISADIVGGTSLYLSNQSPGASQAVSFTATTTTTVILFSRTTVGTATLTAVDCRELTQSFRRDSANFAIWSLSSGMGTPSDAGYYGGANGVTIQCRDATNNFTGRINQASVAVATGITDGSGFYEVNRSGASAHSSRKNGAVVTTNTTTEPSTALLNAEFQYLRYGTGSYSARKLAVGVIGGSLTTTESLDRYNDLLAYLQAIGAVA